MPCLRTPRGSGLAHGNSKIISASVDGEPRVSRLRGSVDSTSRTASSSPPRATNSASTSSNLTLQQRQRGRLAWAHARRRCEDWSRLARLNIANGVDADAGEYAKRAMHEARYAEWCKAKLVGRPFMASPSARPPISWTDVTRNRPPYGHSVTWT